MAESENPQEQAKEGEAVLSQAAQPQPQNQGQPVKPEVVPEAPADYEPPSDEELKRMAERGFRLVDGAYRPRSRTLTVA